MKTTELHRVRCPYCEIGGAIVTVTREHAHNGKPGQVQVDLNQIVRCDTCKDTHGHPNPFRIQPMFSIRGVGLDYRHGQGLRLERDLRLPLSSHEEEELEG